MTDVRLIRWLIASTLAVCLLAATPASGEDTPSTSDRIGDLQQELDSLTEDVDDLKEPIAEFALFEECAYLIGVSQTGGSGAAPAYVFGRAGKARRPALALDIRGFGPADYAFLAFPAEEPPSLECNEDAGEEENGD